MSTQAAQAATCPDCDKETEWVGEYDPNKGEVERLQAICDGCAADRAVAAAFEGTHY